MKRAFLTMGFAIVIGASTIGSTHACSFNCGGTYQKGDEFGLKAPSHSGFKTHEFYNMPKRDHSYEYIKEKDGAGTGKRQTLVK